MIITCAKCGVQRSVHFSVAEAGLREYCRKCSDSNRKGKPNYKLRGRLSPQRNGKYINCLQCNTPFYISLSRIIKGRKFHNNECLSKYKKGRPAPNIPTKFVKNDPRLKNRKLEGHPSWKEWDDLKYGAKHYRIRTIYGKASKCEYIECFYPRSTSKKRLLLAPKRFEWANISHEYKQARSDWIQLCGSCHYLYDHGRLTL